jgi:hypothetical protein
LFLADWRARTRIPLALKREEQTNQSLLEVLLPLGDKTVFGRGLRQRVSRTARQTIRTSYDARIEIALAASKLESDADTQQSIGLASDEQKTARPLGRVCGPFGEVDNDMAKLFFASTTSLGVRLLLDAELELAPLEMVSF